MNDVEIFKNPCAMCKKRVATKLCDYVTDYDRSVLFVRGYEKFKELNSNTRYETCDLPLCESCSYSISNDVDFCKHHYEIHKRSKLPNELEKKRNRGW